MSTGAHVDPHDTFGKIVGILAAVLAVLLSIFTISAHRAHTETIIFQNEANDMWSQYQAKRIRSYQLELTMDLLKTISTDKAGSEKLITVYSKKHDEYQHELGELKTEAGAKVKESTVVEKKAFYFDFAEGILEIALVMSSLYFIAHKRLFPIFGIFFGLLGIIIGMMGFLF